MLKEIEKLNRLRAYDRKVQTLNHNNLHIVYFAYKKKPSNFFHKPALLAMWLFYLFGKKKGRDHVAITNRFVKEGDHVRAKIFESTTYGVFESDLLEKIKLFEGTVWIEDTGFPINEKRQREFENQYLADGYSVMDAVKAGVDGWLGKKLNKLFKKQGIFCSQLVARAAKNQGIPQFLRMSEADLEEITPDDIWEMNIGVKEILFKQ